MFARYVAALFSAALMTTQPAAAAAQLRSEAASSRPAAFGGVVLRLRLGGREPAKPEARLQLTSHRADWAQPGHLRPLDPNGFELGLGKSGKALLFADGQSVTALEHKSGLSTGSTLLIVGGVVVAVVAIALAAGGGAGFGDTCPVIDGSRDHCINP